MKQICELAQNLCATKLHWTSIGVPLRPWFRTFGKHLLRWNYRLPRLSGVNLHCCEGAILSILFHHDIHRPLDQRASGRVTLLSAWVGILQNGFRSSTSSAFCIAVAQLSNWTLKVDLITPKWGQVKQKEATPKKSKKHRKGHSDKKLIQVTSGDKQSTKTYQMEER